MKISIKADPKELAEFLTEFAIRSHTQCQLAEQQLAEQILQGLIPKKKETDIKTEEVPAGGYFQ